MQNIGRAGNDIGRGVSRIQYRFSVDISSEASSNIFSRTPSILHSGFDLVQ